MARVAFALCLVAGATAARAQSPAPPAKPFKATVVDMSGDSRSVIVPLNRSVIIQTSIELARADVVAGQIASAQPISPTELLITGKSYGQTHVVLWDKNDRQYVLDVAVEVDLKPLNSTLKDIDPQSTVEAKSLMGNIVLTGTVSSAERALRMVELAQLLLPAQTGRGAQGPTVQNQLEVAGEQQVMLHCVVAEVNRKATRELGVNGFLAGDNFRDAFVVNQIGGINPISIGAAASAEVTNRIPFLTSETGIPIARNPTLALGFPRVQMQLFLKAMSDNQLASILAEPNLVAISGETASFLAGGEFPIPVPQGNQQVTIQFRQFGVRLNFTPVVKAHQRIRLRVAPEVSELDFSTAVQIQGFVVPGLTSRATETTVEVGNGQTIAIAGLLNEQARGLASRIPGVGDIPVLGALFRSVNFQRSMSELVILVTPELVAPLDAHQPVALPTDDREDPSAFELYMLGFLEAREQAECSPHCVNCLNPTALLRSQPDELSLHGPWGYTGMADAAEPSASP